MIGRPHLDYCHTWEKLLFWGTGAAGAPMGGRGMRPRGAKRPLSACRECSATQQVGRPGSWAAASSSPVPASAARFHATVSVVCWCMNCKIGTTIFLTWEDSFLGSKGPYMMSTDEKEYFCLKCWNTPGLNTVLPAGMVLLVPRWRCTPRDSAAAGKLRSATLSQVHKNVFSCKPRIPTRLATSFRNKSRGLTCMSITAWQPRK